MEQQDSSCNYNRIAQHHSSEIGRTNQLCRSKFDSFPIRTSFGSGGGKQLFWQRRERCGSICILGLDRKALFYYRVAGLTGMQKTTSVIEQVIAKNLQKGNSEFHLCKQPPEAFVQSLLEQREKSQPLQAEVGKQVSMAMILRSKQIRVGIPIIDRLVAILPIIDSIGRWECKRQPNIFAIPLRVGAAGESPHLPPALAAFMMGAAYVVTGKVWKFRLGWRQGKPPSMFRKLLQVVEVQRMVIGRSLAIRTFWEWCRACKYWSGDTIRAQEPRTIISVLQNVWNPLMKSAAAERQSARGKSIQENHERKIWQILYWIFPNSGIPSNRTRQKTIAPEDGLEFSKNGTCLSSNWANAGKTQIESRDFSKFGGGTSHGAFNELGERHLFASTTKIEKWRMLPYK